jgi:hypothetical protein
MLCKGVHNVNMRVRKLQQQSEVSSLSQVC